jgi:DNA-binding transcriptional regulator GbsR (MarR family)
MFRKTEHNYIMDAKQTLFGSPTRTRVLVAIEALQETHVSELARILERPKSRVHKIVSDLELAGILSGIPEGGSRRIIFNPRYSFLQELRPLLAKMLLQDLDLQGRLSQTRRRPRKIGKAIG